MSLSIIITDPRNGLNSQIVNEEEENALVVATRPLKTFENEVKFFTSSTYGIDMNIGRTIDYTEHIYDGTDNAYWTASIISGGKWTLDSTDQNHTVPVGSHSLKSNNSATGNTVQLLRSSDIILTNYNLLIIWVYVDDNWTIGDSIIIYGWDSNTSTIVGNSVKLEDYFIYNNYGVWQQITIPLVDMNLTEETLDSLRVQISTSDPLGPLFYLDDFQFQGTSGKVDASTFLVEPELGTWLYISKITISIANVYSAIVTVKDATENATLPGLSYNQILGETALSSGILYQRVHNKEIQFLAIIRQLSDLLQIPGAVLINQISDGTNTFITIDVGYSEPIILKPENKDFLSIAINDNLSGLLFMRIAATGKSEKR